MCVPGSSGAHPLLSRRQKTRFSGSIGNDTSDCHYLFWFERCQPIQEDHWQSRSRSSGGWEYQPRPRLHRFYINPDRVIDHTFVHHGRAGGKTWMSLCRSARIRADRHILKGDGSHEPTARETHQDCSIVDRLAVLKKILSSFFGFISTRSS